MSSTKLYRLTGQRPMVLPSPGAGWVLDSQFMGVEIEIENFSRRQISALMEKTGLWTEKEDHSLRSGTELVLSSPLLGEDLRDAISTFFSTVTNYSTGPRTSVHVHMNMRQDEDTLEVLRNLCVLYFVYEDAFFQMSDPNRKWCSYCHPFEECPPEPLIEILRGDSLGVVSETFERTSSNSARYYGLNLYALTRYGTVEFRHMPGTRDEGRVVEWINLIMELKKAAATLAEQGLTPASVFSNVEDMSVIETLMPMFGERMRMYVPDALAYRRLGLISAYSGERAVPYRNYRSNAELAAFVNKQAEKIAAARPKSTRKTINKVVDIPEELRNNDGPPRPPRTTISSVSMAARATRAPWSGGVTSASLDDILNSLEPNAQDDTRSNF